MKMTLRSTLYVVLALSCTVPMSSDPGALPHWTFSPDMLFPKDESLAHAEDGVVLADGRLIVGDQFSGLRLLRPDGTGRPFGRFAEAGYQHAPPEIVGGPNGVTLEPSGTHILMSDVFRGGIYRVEVATEATERIYQHPYGVNTARADSAGGIWFSQSTENRPENGEAELFEAVDQGPADGGLFYLPPPAAGGVRTAVQLVDGLRFANGLALDETGTYLYLAETLASRVWRFRLDVAKGRVSDRTIALEVDHPDNLELDDWGRLWIACPVRTEVVVFDPATEAVESVFRISTPESEAQIEQIQARIEEGTGWLDLMGPALWEPGPGLLTGLILSPGDGPVYLTGLGKALVRLERPLGTANESKTATTKEEDPMPRAEPTIMLIVRGLKSDLSAMEMEKRYKERMPQFRDTPGLLQKYYSYDDATGEWAGIYLWDSQESLDAYLASDLRKTIPTAYELTQPPIIERYTIIDVLRP